MGPITAIRGGTLITPAGARRGDLIITGNVITSVGGRTRRTDRVIDASECIVSPGFVTGDARGPWSDPAPDRAVREAVAALLLGGTTCFLAVAFGASSEDVFAASAELGVRATVGRAVSDRDGADGAARPGPAESRARAWEQVMAQIRRWHGAGSGRLRVAVAPWSAGTVTGGMWNDLLELATRTDLIIATHGSASSAAPDEHSNPTDVQRLDRLGALTRRTVVMPDGPLSAADVVRLGATGAHIALASGTDPDLRWRLIEAAAAGEVPVNVAASLTEEPTGTGVRGRFRRATANGARALGYGTRIGELRPGMRADIAVFEAPGAGIDTNTGAMAYLTARAGALGARTVLVDGAVRVDAGVLVSDDRAPAGAELSASRPGASL